MLVGDVNILIVDDVSSMRTQIRSLLKNFGFRNISSCEDPSQAAAYLENTQFNLILCDWHMGDVSGLDFLRYVRQHSGQKDVGFIMVTVEATKERVVEAIQSGVDDYLIKPLTVSQIQEKVYGVLVKKRVL